MMAATLVFELDGINWRVGRVRHQPARPRGAAGAYHGNVVGYSEIMRATGPQPGAASTRHRHRAEQRTVLINGC